MSVWTPCKDPVPVITSRLSISPEEASRRLSKLSCTTLPSEAGLALAERAANAGTSHLPGLTNVYRRQASMTTCGVATMATALDYLNRPRNNHENSSDKSRDLTSEEELFSLAGSTLNESEVRTRGMTLATLARACSKLFPTSTIQQPATVADLKQVLEEHFHCEKASSVLLCNYSMAVAGQGDWWSGHISPVGAYVDGQVLIMDVWMYTAPCWVSLETLLAATRDVDSDSGCPRGFVRVTN